MILGPDRERYLWLLLGIAVGELAQHEGNLLSEVTMRPRAVWVVSWMVAAVSQYLGGLLGETQLPG